MLIPDLTLARVGFGSNLRMASRFNGVEGKYGVEFWKGIEIRIIAFEPPTGAQPLVLGLGAAILEYHRFETAFDDATSACPETNQLSLGELVCSTT